MGGAPMGAVGVELVRTGIHGERYYWRVRDAQTKRRVAVSDVFPNRESAIESLELIGAQVRGDGITDASPPRWHRAAMFAQAVTSIAITALAASLLALLVFMLTGAIDFTELVVLQVCALTLGGVGAVLSILPEDPGHRPLAGNRRPVRLWLVLSVGILVMTLALLFLVDALLGPPV